MGFRQESLFAILLTNLLNFTLANEDRDLGGRSAFDDRIKDLAVIDLFFKFERDVFGNSADVAVVFGSNHNPVRFNDQFDWLAGLERGDVFGITNLIEVTGSGFSWFFNKICHSDFDIFLRNTG